MRVLEWCSQVGEGCWRGSQWLLAILGALTLLALGAYWYVVGQVDEQIRVRAEALLAEKFPAWEVSIASARRIDGVGIELRGVRISLPASDSNEARPVITVDEMLLNCRADLGDLLENNLCVTRKRFRRLTVWAEVDEQGNCPVWDAFLAAGNEPGPVIPAAIEGGVIHLASAEDPGQEIVLREIEAEIEPAQFPGPSGPTTGGRMRLTATGSHCRRLTAEVAWDAAGRFQVAEQIAGLESSRDLEPLLRMTNPDLITWLPAYRGRADLELRFRGQAAVTDDYRIVTTLRDGAVSDPRLPFEFTRVSGEITATPERIAVAGLTGFRDGARLRIDGVARGYTPTSPSHWKIALQQWPLDRRLLLILPEDLIDAWRMFEPSGRMQGQVELTHDGTRWTPQVELHLSELALAYQDFPYPLTEGVGSLRFHQGQLEARLRMSARGAPVRVFGQVSGGLSGGSGRVEVDSERPLPLDETLLSAMPRTVRRIMEDMAPRGQLQVAARVRWSPHEPPSQHLLLDVSDADVRYRYFPYPLRRIAGRIEMRDGDWFFRGFEGRNDSARVACEGSWISNELGGRLQLEFTAIDVPLEDELRDALDLKGQAAWRFLGPRGALDHVEISLTYASGDEAPSVNIVMQKWPSDQNVPGRVITLQPPSLGYRIDEVVFQAELSSDSIEVRQFRGRHDATVLNLQLTAGPTPRESYQFDLSRLAIDNLALDDEFQAALPWELRQRLQPLHLSGVVHLAGAVQLEIDSANRGLRRAAWDVEVDTDQLALAIAAPIREVHGSARIRGETDGKQLAVAADLNLDSLLINDIQVTALRGPVWMSPQMLLAGSWTPRPAPDRLSYPLTGKVFGGSIRVNAQATTGERSPYRLEASLTDARLERVAAELGRPREKLQGRLFAGLLLQGDDRGTAALSGSGNLRIRDGQLYETPTLVALSKLLRPQRPEGGVFTALDSQFTLDGPTVKLSQLDLHGDAVTLKGQGEIDLDRRLNLVFYTLIGRENAHLPLLRPLLGEASRQILEIRVTGNLVRPALDSRPFPGINDTLRQLFPELSQLDGSASAPSPPARR